MSQPSDDSGLDPNGLFARARNGDQSAWEELFYTCYPKIVRVVRRKLTGSPSMRSLYDSTDFASDVWQSLAAKADRYDFPSIDSFMAFLKKAAEQKFIDEHRRQHTLKRDIRREHRLDADPERHEGGPVALPSGDPTPSQFALAGEQFERLLSRLDEPEEREIVILKHQGYSSPEIADQIGWSLRKVERFLQALGRSLEVTGGVR